jgi:hypothetical protein
VRLVERSHRDRAPMGIIQPFERTHRKRAYTRGGGRFNELFEARKRADAEHAQARHRRVPTNWIRRFEIGDESIYFTNA